MEEAYRNLTESDIIVGARPSSGQLANTIYREPDQGHTPPQFYSDYMWYNNEWVLMAEYDNAIDDYPIPGSNNLVKSKGVFNSIGGFDVSVYNSGEIYHNLSEALNDIPSDMRAGGMSIKFIQEMKPAQYTVVKTEGLDTEPSGTELLVDPNIISGTYTPEELSNFPTLPTTINYSLTYYLEIPGDTTTYTRWVITYISPADNKYVQYMYMGTAVSGTPNPFLQITNWQGVDSEIKKNNNLVENKVIAERFESVDLSLLEITGGTYEKEVSDGEIETVDTSSYWKEDISGNVFSESGNGIKREYDLSQYVGKNVKFHLDFSGSPNPLSSSQRMAFVLVNSNMKRPSTSVVPKYNEAQAFAQSVDRVFSVEFVVPEGYTTLLSSYTNINTTVYLDITRQIEGTLEEIEARVGNLNDEVTQQSQSIETLNGEVNNIKVKIDGGDVVTPFDYDQYILHGYMYDGNNEGVLTANENSDYTEPITIPSEYAGRDLKITLFDGLPNNSRACVIYNSDGTYMGNKAKPSGASYPYTIVFNNFPANWKFAISYDKRYAKPTVVFSKEVVGLEERVEQLERNNGNTMYIAPDGSDANEGTSSSPKKTVMNAVLNGASTVIAKAGEYQENINISSYKNLNFRLIADVNAAPIFKNGTTIVDDGSEVQDSTYTNVYSISLANEPATDWIYQHLVDDIQTLIPLAEINPIQRGKKYRCDSTRISKISSSESLDTIKSQINSNAQNNLYKWHYRDGVLYFSRPSISSSSHPIIIPSEHCFYNNEPTNRIFLSGINFYYGNCEIQNCDDVIVQNCSAKYAASNGAFRWVKCRNIKFIKCEAARAKTRNGDGFNGGGAGTALLPVHSSVYLIDCWAHDNNDDGYSDHDGCEAQVVRGLYEYNQKAGITPSYGSHCVATQAISRRNVNGFYYTGTLRGDLGLNGNALFVECLAENNTESGFRVNGVGNENVPNSIECIDCVSIGNSDGYRNNENNGQMILRDCKTKNNTNDVNGTATIINSQLLSE